MYEMNECPWKCLLCLAWFTSQNCACAFWLWNVSCFLCSALMWASQNQALVCLVIVPNVIKLSTKLCAPGKWLTRRGRITPTPPVRSVERSGSSETIFHRCHEYFRLVWLWMGALIAINQPVFLEQQKKSARRRVPNFLHRLLFRAMLGNYSACLSFHVPELRLHGS